MPELPEVQTVLDGLSSVLQDRIITGLECYYPGTVIFDPDLGSDPFPCKLSNAVRRGKYMLLNMDNGITMIVHLRMTGKLIYDPSALEPHKHERARILLMGNDAIRFIDPRTFGKISLLKSVNLSKFMPILGPEPLSTDFNTNYLQKVLAGRNAPIKNLLLDQSLVAGLGNIYVCELLYRAKVQPQRQGKSISPKEAKLIVKHGKAVLQEALQVGGTSISDYRRIDDKSGEFQNFLQAYQKPTCPKGHKMHNIRLGGRSSFYCPLCQK